LDAALAAERRSRQLPSRLFCGDISHFLGLDYQKAPAGQPRWRSHASGAREPRPCFSNRQTRGLPTTSSPASIRPREFGDGACSAPWHCLRKPEPRSRRNPPSAPAEHTIGETGPNDSTKTAGSVDPATGLDPKKGRSCLSRSTARLFAGKPALSWHRARGMPSSFGIAEAIVQSPGLSVDMGRGRATARSREDGAIKEPMANGRWAAGGRRAGHHHQRFVAANTDPVDREPGSVRLSSSHRALRGGMWPEAPHSHLRPRRTKPGAAGAERDGASFRRARARWAFTRRHRMRIAACRGLVGW